LTTSITIFDFSVNAFILGLNRSKGFISFHRFISLSQTTYYIHIYSPMNGRKNAM